MEHEELIEELPMIVEKLTPAERIQLAKERRAVQLAKQQERDAAAGPPPPRNIRLKFRPEIALLEATSRNDVDEVHRLLAEGANPNSHNEDGLTPLHQCAIDNNEDILRTLLEFGADVNAQDTEQWTPLHAAACCAHKNIVRHLIQHGANLMSVNADGNMPYDICDDDDTLDLIESEMARQGITQEQIDDERGAAERLMLADMKLLHQRGAPLDARDPDGASPLHVAAAHGFYDVAAFLLKCGVSPGVRDNDLWQPMHAAACWAQPDVIELLAEYGGDVNAKTATGETPLDLCEDDTTRAIIATLQAEAARKRRHAFGARDSRRQSRKKKAFSKFESPQQPQSDSPFSARGAIRRLSLRDKSGISLARLEARKEGSDLMRSMSMEDSLSNINDGTRPADVHLSMGGRRNSSPHKRAAGASSIPKAGVSPDEWARKLQADADNGNDTSNGNEDGNATGSKSADRRTDRRRGAAGGGKKRAPGTPQANDASGSSGGASRSGARDNGAPPADRPVHRFKAHKDEVVGAEGERAAANARKLRCQRCCVIS